MKVILISAKHGGSRSVELGRWSRALLSLCCLGLPLGLVAIGYEAGMGSEVRSTRGAALDTLNEALDEQAVELEEMRSVARRQLQAMTLNLAELEARVTRLDALGEHLTALADLEQGEFDFSQPPALGGPVPAQSGEVFESRELATEFERLEAKLTDREQQLDILESLLSNREIHDQRWLSGLPVRRGHISSHYGYRNDPISGERAWHHGVDFAGKMGSDILAVAAGIVTWAGVKYGYGNLVEISHGDGLVTRYAHNQKNLVEAGDVVRKGDTIALMGSTGRSTGPHVHYEIYKHGRSVDPASYLARTRR